MKWTYKNQINNFLTAVSNDSEGELWIYGDITNKRQEEDDVSPMYVQNALNNMGPVKTLNIRINSYGGSVPAGNAIIDDIDIYKLRNRTFVNAFIEGIAASMASGIAMVADKIYMAENALMMLHKPYTIVVGNEGDLEKEIEVLQKTEDTLVKNYMRHFKGTEEELRDMLAKETWLTANEALQYGLCDEVIGAVQIAASAKGIVVNGVEFQQAADKIAAKFCPGTPLAKAEPVENEPKGEDKVFEYDEMLNAYGIDEESFKDFNIGANVALNLLAYADASKPKPYMTVESVKDALGEEMDADKVLALAKAGMEIDQHMSDKANAYDKLVNSAIEDAIKNGIRAKGENFNETRWKKILSNFDYNEIVEQSNEWGEEAKIALKAGRRVSEPWQQSNAPDNNQVNPDDYSSF